MASSGILLSSSKEVNPQNNAFGAQEFCTKLSGTVQVWNTVSFQTFFLVEEGDYFAEGTEKCKILGNSMDRELENMEDHGCYKIHYLVDEEISICSSYPMRHKTTLHCSERKANVFRNWIMRH